ncbi:MAG: hypothetical protein RI963_3470 [Planctomycetota bacterium]|jgi:hypothetical protein
MVGRISLGVAVLFATVASGEESREIYSGQGDKSPKQPQAFVAVDGATHLTFGVGNEVFYARGQGESFDQPLQAFTVPNMSLGMRRGPRIASSGDAVVITAIGGAQGKGRDGDLIAYRSTDRGKRWQGPIRINDVDASAREGLHAMTATDDGVLWCVWLDLRAKKTELYASKSLDGGLTWERNRLVYRSPGGSICECCHPSVVARGDTVQILFRNSLGGNRDMYLVTSDDAGKTFGEAVRLGDMHWVLNACPMDGGMLAVDKGGSVATVWRREGMLYWTAGPAAEERVLGKGEQAWVASDPSGSYAVWTTAREGDLIFARLGSDPQRVATASRDPIIVATASPDSSPQLFWEERRGDRVAIMWRSIR